MPRTLRGAYLPWTLGAVLAVALSPLLSAPAAAEERGAVVAEQAQRIRRAGTPMSRQMGAVMSGIVNQAKAKRISGMRSKYGLGFSTTNAVNQDRRPGWSTTHTQTVRLNRHAAVHMIHRTLEHQPATGTLHVTKSVSLGRGGTKTVRYQATPLASALLRAVRQPSWKESTSRALGVSTQVHDYLKQSQGPLAVEGVYSHRTVGRPNAAPVKRQKLFLVDRNGNRAVRLSARDAAQLKQWGGIIEGAAAMQAAR